MAIFQRNAPAPLFEGMPYVSTQDISDTSTDPEIYLHTPRLVMDNAFNKGTESFSIKFWHALACAVRPYLLGHMALHEGNIVEWHAQQTLTWNDINFHFTLPLRPSDPLLHEVMLNIRIR